MSEQAEAPKAEEAPKTIPHPNPDLAGAEITSPVKPEQNYAPLFEGEAISEEDLMGESATEEKAAASEPEGDKKEEGEPEAEKEQEPEKKEDPPVEAKEEKPEEAPDEKKDEGEPQKPPPGYVPLEAVQQERQKTKTLRAENQRLAAELEILKTPVNESEESQFKDFKVKSAAEYKELLTNDPDAASMYLYELNLYNDYKTRAANKKQAEAQAKASKKELIDEGAREIEKLLPGFHKKENKDAEEIAKFAVKTGLSPDILFDITNPETTILTASGERYVLGPGAAQVIGVLKNHRETASKISDEASLREKVKAELTPIIEAELQKTLMEKLKQDPSGGFKSLDSATSSHGKKVKPIMGAVTESDFAKLTEAEQVSLLGG